MNDDDDDDVYVVINVLLQTELQESRKLKIDKLCLPCELYLLPIINSKTLLIKNNISELNIFD